MPQYALVVMVDHPIDSDALPELSSRQRRTEGNRYRIAANDDEMERIARSFRLEPELAFLNREAIPMIEIDAARLTALSLDVTPQALIGEAEVSADVPARLADLEQAIACIHSSQCRNAVPNAGAATVRAYLERIEEALSSPAQS